MTGYIDIHTHQQKNKDYMEVVNLFPENAEKTINENPDSFFSVGLHPWYINKHEETLLQNVQKLSTHKNIVAIGETGLDKLSQTDFSLQIEVFKAQIRIAEKVNKPLIIHCVKAYQEVLATKKEMQVNVPMIFHAFRGKSELAQQLLQHDCYLSVGEQAVHIPETIKTIPFHRLFIETDESTVDLKDIYQAVADIKEISIEELKKLIQQNVETIFTSL